jgi:transposase
VKVLFHYPHGIMYFIDKYNELHIDMTSRRYKSVSNRQQISLLPPSIEDYVHETNSVRAIDAYVETLDLAKQGFQNTAGGVCAGQPAYPPEALLKLYLYGYINKVRSSRRLESETYRNLEVIWLVEELRPSYKTIADFRKNNSKALTATNRDFVLLCKDLQLFGGETLGIDGSFFKADASKAGIYTEKKLNQQLQQLDDKINAYQEQLAAQDEADNQAGLGSLTEDKQLNEKITALKEKQAIKKALQKRLQESDSKQISTVDPDARLLSKRGQTIAGYNVQIAVDAKHKLIVAEAVTQDGNDTQQLMPMIDKAQAILASTTLTVLADSGYYEGNQIKQCEDQHIIAYVAIPDKSKAIKAQGRYTRDQFKYNIEGDAYTCRQGMPLTRYGTPYQINNKNYTRYKSKVSACKQCPVRSQCLTDKATSKQLLRWEHEDVAERHQNRMQNSKGIMRQRGALVEHPFGTLKRRAGWDHFLMRGLEKSTGEFSLMVLGYNFTRVLNILGIDTLRDYCVQRSSNKTINLGFA